MDFEAAYKRHGEHFMWDILENWERYNRVRHPRPMALEERWAYFIRATDYPATVAA